MEYDTYKKIDARLKGDVVSLLELIVETVENFQKRQDDEDIKIVESSDICDFNFIKQMPKIEYSTQIDNPWFEARGIRNSVIKSNLPEVEQQINRKVELTARVVNFYQELSIALLSKDADFEYEKAFEELKNTFKGDGVLYWIVDCDKAVESAFELEKRLRKHFENEVYKLTPPYIFLSEGLKGIDTKNIRKYKNLHLEMESILAARVYRCIARSKTIKADDSVRDLIKYSVENHHQREEPQNRTLREEDQNGKKAVYEQYKQNKYATNLKKSRDAYRRGSAKDNSVKDDSARNKRNKNKRNKNAREKGRKEDACVQIMDMHLNKLLRDAKRDNGNIFQKIFYTLLYP